MPTTGIMLVVAYAPAADQALFQLLQFPPDKCDLPRQKQAVGISAAKFCLGRGEISPGCCYADPGNVDWSRWMPSHPPLLTASSLRETPNAGQRSVSRQRGRPW